MARLAVLLVVLLFFVGLALLTIEGIAQHGFTFEAAVSVLVLLLVGVGILAAIRNPPGR